MSAKDLHPELTSDFDSFDVCKAVAPENGVSLFILHVPDSIFAEGRQKLENMKEYWDATWKRAGSHNPPEILFLGKNIDLCALGDAELRNLGLMRIPK